MTVSVARSLLMVFLLGLFVLLLGAACGGEEEAAGGEQEANGGGNKGADSPGVEGVIVNEFGDFDTNNDDELDQQEFNEGVFRNWDVDNNDEITREEFNDTTPTGFEKFNDFNDWNTDNDEVLTQEEYNAHPGVEGGDLFEGYDANNDNAIDPNEFNEGVAQGGATTMQGATTSMAATSMDQETTGSGTLVPSGGPSILLPAAALLLGSAVLGYALVRRT